MAFSTFLVKEIAEALKFITDTFRSGRRGPACCEHLPDGIERLLSRVLDWISQQSGGQLESGRPCSSR